MRIGLTIPLPALCACALALGGCMSGGSDEGGGTLGNLLRYGGTTVPAAAPTPRVEASECPPVTVNEGGAAIRALGGDTVRSQVSISNVARECIERDDGATVLKVGVAGRVLLGPGGSPGRFEAPVVVSVKRGEQVFASRSRRVAVTVAPGQASGEFSTVESDIVVPAGTGEFEIEVGLGSVSHGTTKGAGRRSRG